MNFSKTLVSWYLQNKRELPWRNTVNPYPIWLSEIMLQQTRVAQGLPYFLKFTERFPTVFDLATADEETVLKLWQGLGYYSRARNLHQTAQTVAEDFDGKFPSTYKELLKLKGIGEYTAAAIASFAFNENVAVVDGNVFRVLARYFDIETDIASSAAKKEFTALAQELLPKGKANIFNQAIMEFGALQCVPKNPDCKNCVLNDSCLALKYKKVTQLPVKLKKTKVQKRFFNYLIFKDERGNTLLQKRTQKGIWHNLYEFPLLETLEELTDITTIELIKSQSFVQNKIEYIKLMNTTKIAHKLSHQHLSISFWEITVDGTLDNGIDSNAALAFPFPIVIFNFISSIWE
ncbi:A/G-specific adenine glycosylase [Flavobacterium sp.]